MKIKRLVFIILSATLIVSTILSSLIFYNKFNGTLASVLFVSAVVLAVAFALYISSIIVYYRRRYIFKKSIMSQISIITEAMLKMLTLTVKS